MGLRSLAAFSFLIGCGYPPLPEHLPDAMSGNWSPATPVRNLATGDEEDNPSCTRDHRTIVFSSHRSGRGSELILATRASPGDDFTTTELIAVNSAVGDTSPEINPDGDTIYFVSERDPSKADVFVTRKTGGSWSAAEPVPSLKSADDVAISPDELTAIVVRSKQFWLATRPSREAEFIAAIHLPAFDLLDDPAAPSITNNADVVYFHAGDDSQTRDLYHARRTGPAQYSAPELVGDLNTPGRDAAPFVSGDEHYMIFNRNDDLYETTR